MRELANEHELQLEFAFCENLYGKSSSRFEAIYRTLEGIRFLKVQPIYGVYFLFRGERIVYVGQSTNVRKRVDDHVRDAKSFDKVGYIPVPESDLDRVERFWINRLKPELNKDQSQVVQTAILIKGKSHEHYTYWLKRVFQSSGNTNYAVRIQQRGSRHCFDLKTPNKYAAAGRAREIYNSIRTRGWTQTLAEYEVRSIRKRRNSAPLKEWVSSPTYESNRTGI
jgi:hypothetical protein